MPDGPIAIRIMTVAWHLARLRIAPHLEDELRSIAREAADPPTESRFRTIWPAWRDHVETDVCAMTLLRLGATETEAADAFAARAVELMRECMRLSAFQPPPSIVLTGKESVELARAAGRAQAIDEAIAAVRDLSETFVPNTDLICAALEPLRTKKEGP